MATISPLKQGGAAAQTEGDHKVTGSPAAQAAGWAVMSLAKAARSFVLYDSNNKLVRQLLEQFRDKTKEALASAPALPLDFGPFEVRLNGEVVYLDKDREKSMAFKLFRDGIRRITILQSVTFDELFRLLEIVALRYTAMRQQEEDSVTLIRKAGFRGIQLVAVEGFAPAEERPEADAPMEFLRAPRVEPPADFDTPLPRLPAPGQVEYRAMPPMVLSALQAEETDAAWAMSSIALAKVLLEEAKRTKWPEPREDLVQYFVELREAMLADNAFAALKQLLELVEKSGAADVQKELLGGLADPKALDAILEFISPEATSLPKDLVGLLPFLSGSSALDKMLVEQDDRKRAMLLELVLASGPRSADEIFKKLPTLEPALALTVARGLAAASPKLTVEVGKYLLGSADDALKLEGLDVLVKGKAELPMTLVIPLLDAGSPELRLRAIEVFEKRADEKAMGVLIGILENKDRPLPEVEALGRALASLNPLAASRTFIAWGHPKGRVIGGLTAQQKRLQWAAVAGFSVLPGPEPDKQLQSITQGADENLRRHCFAAMARRRKAAAGRG